MIYDLEMILNGGFSPLGGFLNKQDYECVISDMRLKDNIESLGNTISDILKLDGKSYTRDGRNEIGLLAQDVELIYPELVSVDRKGMLAVNYQALSAILINGVKDQEARISKQEERIANLEILVQLLLNKE